MAPQLSPGEWIKQIRITAPSGRPDTKGTVTKLLAMRGPMCLLRVVVGKPYLGGVRLELGGRVGKECWRLETKAITKRFAVAKKTILYTRTLERLRTAAGRTRVTLVITEDIGTWKATLEATRWVFPRGDNKWSVRRDPDLARAEPASDADGDAGSDSASDADDDSASYSASDGDSDSDAASQYSSMTESDASSGYRSDDPLAGGARKKKTAPADAPAAAVAPAEEPAAKPAPQPAGSPATDQAAQLVGLFNADRDQFAHELQMAAKSLAFLAGVAVTPMPREANPDTRPPDRTYNVHCHLTVDARKALEAYSNRGR